MTKIKLDERLTAVASMVRQGCRVTDIGTDHGYLAAYLVGEGLCPSGIASDLRTGPLENARRTVENCGLSDRIKLILSDGLKNISPEDCDDIVLAGMGGNLIADILSAAPWVRDSHIHIIAQPMTHAEVLRRYFVDNGFDIESERAVIQDRHIYCVISAYFAGKKRECPASYFYTGELFQHFDSCAEKYVEKTLKTLRKKYEALSAAGKEDASELRQIIGEIEGKLTEARNDESK